MTDETMSTFMLETLQAEQRMILELMTYTRRFPLSEASPMGWALETVIKTLRELRDGKVTWFSAVLTWERVNQEVHAYRVALLDTKQYEKPKNAAWHGYVYDLCAIRDRLKLMDDANYDEAHPIFAALDAVKPDMSAEAETFVRGVIEEYAEVRHG